MTPNSTLPPPNLYGAEGTNEQAGLAGPGLQGGSMVIVRTALMDFSTLNDFAIIVPGWLRGRADKALFPFNSRGVATVATGTQTVIPTGNAGNNATFDNFSPSAGFIGNTNFNTLAASPAPRPLCGSNLFGGAGTPLAPNLQLLGLNTPLVGKMTLAGQGIGYAFIGYLLWACYVVDL